MRTALRTAVSLTLIAIVLHSTLRYALVSLLPIPIFLSTLWVWMLPAPGYYFITLAVIGELFTGLPPGITTVIVIIPSIVFRLRSHIQAGVSFSFFLLLVVTYLLQLLVLALAHLWPVVVGANSWEMIVAAVPWQLLGGMLLANSVATWLCCVLWPVLFPSKHQLSRLFDRERYAP